MDLMNSENVMKGGEFLNGRKIVISAGIMVEHLANQLIEAPDAIYSMEWLVETVFELRGVSNMLHELVVQQSWSLDEMLVKIPDDMVAVIGPNPLNQSQETTDASEDASVRSDDGDRFPF